MKKKGVNPKLSVKFIGPYTVKALTGYHTYLVERDGKTSIQSESRIKLHVERDSRSTHQVSAADRKIEEPPDDIVESSICEEEVHPIERLQKETKTWKPMVSSGIRHKTSLTTARTSSSNVIVQPKKIEPYSPTSEEPDLRRPPSPAMSEESVQMTSPSADDEFPVARSSLPLDSTAKSQAALSSGEPAPLVLTPPEDVQHSTPSVTIKQEGQ